MRQLSGCDNGPCPKTFDPQDGTGDVLVQGYTQDPSVLPEGSIVPAGEQVVRVPREILEQMARELEFS